jgi:hypothetical protein
VSFDVPAGPPPSEPPPGGPPPSGPVEYLDSRGGDGTPPSSSGSGRRTTVIAVAAFVGVAAVGGAAWAAWSFFSTGAQPAEALPASTLGYVSIDLDPSGGQKIEALRALKQFPAFEDEIGLDTDDDIREWIFDKIQGEVECAGLDYDEDIEPWLGDRFAIAAVDTGDDQAPVFVVQVSDEDAADEGLAKLRECGGGGPDDVAWSIDGDWALIGADQQVVDDVAKDAATSTLADDDDFKKWTDAAGDGGIMSMYAAPAAGKVLAEDLDGLGLFGSTIMEDSSSDGTFSSETTDSPPPDELTEALKDFKGAAATVRFDDGGLELELAADPAATGRDLTAGDEGAEAVATLPDDTAAAIGMSFDEGWVVDIFDQVAKSSGESADDLMTDLSTQLGIDLPGDLETLVGESVAVALDADFDPSSVMSSPGSDAGSDLTGIGVKVLGDSDDIGGVLDKLRASADGADGGIIDSDAKGDVVAIGPDADYRAVLLEDGGLGDSDVFKSVVEHADDAAAIVYVNFDAGDDWLAELAGDDAEVHDNLAPLKALGLSSWVDDDVAHAVIKVTTD